MKTFSNFTGTISVTHGEESITLAAVQQTKGTKGFYPGVIGSDSTTSELNAFIGVDKFDKWVARKFNEDTQLIWRDVCEDNGASKDTVLTSEQTKLLRENFTSYLVDSLDGKRSVERDAAWYQAAIVKLNKRLQKAVADKKPDDINKCKVELAEMKPLWIAAREAEAEAMRALDLELASIL